MIAATDPSNLQNKKMSDISSSGDSSDGNEDGAGEEPLPIVMEISGIGGDLEATVKVYNAGVFTVKAGDNLPNGIRVLEVQRGGVTIYSGIYNAKKTLGIGEVSYNQPQQSQMMQPAIPIFQ
eukprot:NODE_14659_length_419_cov_0.845890_g14636_i0.p1 GENE.NODE_14659_length_419_cov_0.845890_g14636_i0~~NODE_14659_length_419_cov_0.845890_g14636_i0.p1  ORF type:complete len:122 (-),score=1.26 NODE_14659_length_419_cov_0.845890_g14636_i0:52-417(-)